MTLFEALKDIAPGEVISCGKPDESNFTEIFVLQDKTIRFSDKTMIIDNETLSSKDWRK